MLPTCVTMLRMSNVKPYDLRSGLGYRLSLAAHLNQMEFESDLTTLGITRQMWCVLIAVGQHQITRPTEIAAYIGINRTAASRSIRQMAQRGLLERRNGTQDKRTNEVNLTEKGVETLQKALPMAQNAQNNLRSRLSENELSQLSNLLDKLIQTNNPPVAGI